MTKFCLSLGMALFICSINVEAKQASIQLSVTPQQCVALHRGQTCYQQILFQWKTPEVGRYCLTESKSGQNITCWYGEGAKQYLYDFEGVSSTFYSLIRPDSQNSLAEAKVVVTWVYKAPKQSHSGWRLF